MYNYKEQQRVDDLERDARYRKTDCERLFKIVNAILEHLNLEVNESAVLIKDRKEA